MKDKGLYLGLVDADNKIFNFTFLIIVKILYIELNFLNKHLINH